VRISFSLAVRTSFVTHRTEGPTGENKGFQPLRTSQKHLFYPSPTGEKQVIATELERGLVARRSFASFDCFQRKI
jgi:hypothetical protein